MEQKIKRVKKDKTPQQALQSLMRMCARSERSSGDALRLMKRWGVTDEEARKVLARLQADRFIDDGQLAFLIVADTDGTAEVEALQSDIDKLAGVAQGRSISPEHHLIGIRRDLCIGKDLVVTFVHVVLLKIGW